MDNVHNSSSDDSWIRFVRESGPNWITIINTDTRQIIRKMTSLGKGLNLSILNSSQGSRAKIVGFKYWARSMVDKKKSIKYDQILFV